MKSRFDFRRFVQVLRLSWQTQPILPYIVLIAAVPLMFLFFFSDANSTHIRLDSHTPFSMFNIYLYGCGWLYAGTVFNDLGRQGGATRYLMLPGSVFEKWLAKSLLVFFVFPVITWLTFNAAFKLFEFFSLRWFAFRYDPIDWTSGDIAVTLFFFYLALPAAYTSGLFWKRFGIWKGFVFFFILSVVMYQLLEISTDRYAVDSGSRVLIQAIDMPFFEKKDLDTVTRSLVRLYWALTMYAPSLLLLCSTYFFIKEKEL